MQRVVAFTSHRNVNVTLHVHMLWTVHWHCLGTINSIYYPWTLIGCRNFDEMTDNGLSFTLHLWNFLSLFWHHVISLWMRCYREWILMDGMGLAYKACRRHSVIDATRMRNAISKRLNLALFFTSVVYRSNVLGYLLPAYVTYNKIQKGDRDSYNRLLVFW